LTALVAALLSGSLPCLAQGKVPVADEPNLLQQTLGKAIAARVKPHPELKPFQGRFEVYVVKVSDDGLVMRLQAPNNGGVFHLHSLVCDHGAMPDRVSDAVILGPLESARQFYDDNLSTTLIPSADSDLLRCVREGWRLTTTGGVTKSRTRILSHMDGLLRYFLQYKPDPRRGADLLQVAAAGWREELQALNESKDLNSLSRGLHLIDGDFPFELLERARLDDVTRAASRELLNTTLFLRRKLSAFDEKAGAYIERDEALLARLGVP
jgi:hypothetical protein